MRNGEVLDSNARRDLILYHPVEDRRGDAEQDDLAGFHGLAGVRRGTDWEGEVGALWATEPGVRNPVRLGRSLALPGPALPASANRTRREDTEQWKIGVGRFHSSILPFGERPVHFGVWS